MKILIAYDGSISADAAIEDLRRAGLPGNTEALVISVEDGGLPDLESSEIEKAEDSWTSNLAEAELLVQKASARLRSYFPQWTVSSEALWGKSAKAILDTCGWWHPDLLIVGSHGRSGIQRLFLGSVSLELVHKAPCSVRVARSSASSDSHPTRIIIGNDGSKEAEAAVRSLAARPWPAGSEAKVISVVRTLVPVITALEANTYGQEPAFEVIREADEQMRVRLRTVAGESADCLRRSGLIASSSVVDGDPREVILTEAEALNADAVFLGARGLGQIERLLVGSVSSYVVTHAQCTVEIVRGRDA